MPPTFCDPSNSRHERMHIGPGVDEDDDDEGEEEDDDADEVGDRPCRGCAHGAIEDIDAHVVVAQHREARDAGEHRAGQPDVEVLQPKAAS